MTSLGAARLGLLVFGAVAIGSGNGYLGLAFLLVGVLIVALYAGNRILTLKAKVGRIADALDPEHQMTNADRDAAALSEAKKDEGTYGKNWRAEAQGYRETRRMERRFMRK